LRRLIYLLVIAVAAPARGAVDATLVAKIDATARAVGWADWDRDGDLDLAIGAGSDVLVYRNHHGVLTLAYSTHTDGVWDLAWGDVNGDGAPDLAIGGPTSISILINNGSGTGWDESYVVMETGAAAAVHGVAFGDVDGDQDLDLAASAWN